MMWTFKRNCHDRGILDKCNNRHMMTIQTLFCVWGQQHASKWTLKYTLHFDAAFSCLRRGHMQAGGVLKVLWPVLNLKKYKLEN
jgi:hypothetical protein